MVSFSRRSLLHWAGLGAAAAALEACGVDAGAGTSESDIEAVDFLALRDRIGGRVVLPGDAAYEGARLGYNPLFDGQRPAAVAQCASVEDVQACVAFARETGTRFAARSGGHSYAGYSTPDQGLVLDLKRMNQITIHGDGTATVGCGARLIEVYTALGEAGLCLPAGSCPSVGISGVTLGGGIGVLARLHGLTCDRLVSAEVVLADGTRRTASPTSEPDLYWALRGGGGGNFAIVTSFTFSTPPSQTMQVFSLRFPSGSQTRVLAAWLDWIQSGPPRELFSNCIIEGALPPAIRVNGAFAGSAAALQPLLDDFKNRIVALGGPSPTDASFVKEKGYLDAMRFFASCSTKSLAQCHLQSEGGEGVLGRESFVASSCMFEESAMGSLERAFRLEGVMNQHAGVGLIIDSFGGAIADLAPDATAFPHRDAIASVQVFKATSPASQAADRQVVSKVRGMLAPLVGGGAYINYIDPTMPDWAAASYGGNLARLQEVAKRYDPTGFFSFAQSVASTAA